MGFKSTLLTCLLRPAVPAVQVVVLSSVLACDATMGYESTLGIRDSPVTAFNGQRVHNLAQLARLVQASREEYMRFDLEAANKVRWGAWGGVWWGEVEVGWGGDGCGRIKRMHLCALHTCASCALHPPLDLPPRAPPASLPARLTAAACPAPLLPSSPALRRWWLWTLSQRGSARTSLWRSTTSLPR
jgi:hypothetical protein